MTSNSGESQKGKVIEGIEKTIEELKQELVRLLKLTPEELGDYTTSSEKDDLLSKINSIEEQIKFNREKITKLLENLS